MKRIILSACLMVFTLAASAQYEKGTWSLQPKVGFGASYLSNCDLYIDNKRLDNEFSVAASAGIEAEYQALQPLSISLGMFYAQRGTAWEDINSSNVDLSDLHYELNYIDIPFTANLYFARGWALHAGVQVGFLLSAYQKQIEESRVEGRKLVQTSSLDIRNLFKTVEMSVPVGISYEFKNHLVLDARYNFGLTDINDFINFDHDKHKSGVFMLSVGYKCKL